MMGSKITTVGLKILSGLVFCGAVSCTNSTEKFNKYKFWGIYGGSSENIKYSALSQINTSNVKKLKVAWTYSSGQSSATNTTDMKTNAVVVDGILYGLNPQLKLFALDAATGKEKWV